MSVQFLIKIRWRQDGVPGEYIHYASVGEVINWGEYHAVIENIQTFDGVTILEELRDGEIINES